MTEDIFADAGEEVEQERQRLVDAMVSMDEARPLHFHLSHTILPEYLIQPENLVELQDILSKGSEDQLVEKLYQRSVEGFPGCRRFFDPGEISCSKHSISCNRQDEDDFPLLALEMPHPIAPKESAWVCMALMPRREFYLNQEWRYFVIDAVGQPDSPSEIIMCEYIQSDKVQALFQGKEGDFLPMGSCWPTLDGLLETLKYKWDERFYIL